MTATMTAKGRKMFARFPGTCTECSTRFPAGAEIFWGKQSGTQHVTCVEWRITHDRPEDIADIATAFATPTGFAKVVGEPNCGKPGGCESHDGECDPHARIQDVADEYVFTPCWAGGRCEDAPCCGCGE